MANTKKYISLDKLGVYNEKIKGVVSAGDAAALKDAKEYADGLAVNYDAAGSAATVQSELDKEAARAKEKEEELAGSIADAQGEVDALETVVAGKADASALEALANKVGEVPEGSTVMGIINNIQENAYDDTELRGLITGLDTNKADKTQVATDIETAVNAEKSARETAVAGVQSAVDTLSGTHATDKKDLEDAIALKADATTVNELAEAAATKVALKAEEDRAKGEEARIEGLVTAEAEAARAAEKANADAIAAIKEDVDAFFKDADMTESAKDTLKELQTYIASDETAASEMAASIQQNKKAIEDHVATDHDFAGADAALKAELEGKINGKVAQGDFDAVEERVEVAEGKITAVEGKVSTLEGKMTAVEGAVATKAEAQALTDAVAALEGADATLAGKISALEGKFGGAEGSVEDMIADAQAAAEATAAADATQKANKALEDAKKYADDEDAKIEERVGALEAASATHALKTEVEAVSGRVGTLETKVGTLETEMDAVEALAAANKLAHEANAAAILLKASQEDLNAVSNRVTNLETWHNNFTEASEEEINGLFA